MRALVCLCVLGLASAAAGPAPPTIRVRVIQAVHREARTEIILNRGSASGVTAGMKGVLIDSDNKPVIGTSFTIAKVNAREAWAVIAATTDTVQHAPTALLSP